MLEAQHIQAVLVVYKQKAAECSSWKSLQATAAGRAMRWLVVDNSPQASGSPNPETAYEHFPENLGVSGAYVRGAAHAQQNGCHWLLLLDQDSEFPSHWFEAYHAALTSYPEATLLVPAVPAGHRWMSPARYHLHRGWLNQPMPPGRFSLQQYAPINAGMLISLPAYLACGGHHPAVALDFSDFAFLQRFQKYQTQAVLAAFSLKHRLSGLEGATFESRLSRFHIYCRDAAVFARTGGPAGWLRFWALWRALVLVVRYRRLQFFRVFWREFKTH